MLGRLFAFVILSVALATMGVLSTSLRSRDLEVMDYQATMSGPRDFCYIENGFDYVGFDIANAPGAVDTCCGKCTATANCRAWSWSNHNGGTCWLKSGRGDIIVNPNVKSAWRFYGGRAVCRLLDNLDYVGNDLTRVDSANADGCCKLCQDYLGCRAYTWTDYLGGSCWLKSKAGQAVFKSGARSAEAYPDIYDGCTFVEYGSDYVGWDLTNKPSPDYTGCCSLCKSTANCRAYTWSNHTGGTCWLKSRKGETAYKNGVISSVVAADPDPGCRWEEGVDFVDHDLANKPSADPQGCCGICRAFRGCQAFTWSTHNGGTCWLKSTKDRTTKNTAAKSATIVAM